MSVHSIIPPSSAGIWGSTNGCTGWVQMSQQYPELEESIESKEGSASHQIGESLIQDATRGPSSMRNSDKFIAKQADNGIIYNREMYDAARIYAEDVTEIMHKNAVFGGENLGIEKRIHAPEIHEKSFGTVDSFIFTRRINHLYVWDYKFGHVVVDPFENWQTINYISGIMTALNINGLDDQNITVHIRIVQPRAFHKGGPVREWVVKLSDLRAYFNTLKANAHEALSGNAVIRTGPHCRHCKARHACPAALKAGLLMYEMVMQPTPVDLTPEAIGVQLAIIKRAAKQIEYLESSFEEQAKALIRKGVLIPNFMVENTKGHLAWNKPTVEVIELGKLLGVELKKPDEPITPTQAKNLGIDEAIINAYSEKPNRGAKLVLDNGSKAQQVFN